MEKQAPLIDSHCHLSSVRNKGKDLTGVLERFGQEGGQWLLDVGLRVDDWEERRALASLSSGLRFSCGVHPSEASDPMEPDWGKLEKNLSDPLCIALGEIGLDWYRGREYEKRQREFFGLQLDLAVGLGLPVLLHVRSSMSDVFQELERVRGKVRGIFHCFSGDAEEAKKALDLDFMLSFAGNLTYKGSENLRKAAVYVPEDRVLVETDAPYLAPVPYRGQINEPAWTSATLSFLAQLRACELSRLRERTALNFQEFFHLSV
ncbi:MAG: TatD family hydrolase [Spirochaetales bacterium]|nr:TatD family hydrolase [Spirochaetales bacterium]